MYEELKLYKFVDPYLKQKFTAFVIEARLKGGSVAFLQKAVQLG